MTYFKEKSTCAGEDLKHTLHKPIVVIGAGMAGLAAALLLSGRGHRVIVIEKNNAPGGKMRLVEAGGRSFDAGPTVLTMKWVFDELLGEFGTELEREISLEKSEVLARHFWSDGESLDLFANVSNSANAIASFSDARNAEGYLRFCADSKAIFDTLQRSYIAAPRPGPLQLGGRIGMANPGKLLGLKPFSTLWSALGSYFPDPRLRQLFARYATYCGSSPFQAPATLMLVAHVEQDGVWLIKGGMHALAVRLRDLAKRNGAEFRFGQKVERLVTNKGRVVSVETSDGAITADRVIFNGDVSDVADLLGNPLAPKKVIQKHRSLSALVACMVARPVNKSLQHHNVFFSDDYKSEFDAIFKSSKPPSDPTVYLCALDRSGDGHSAPSSINGAERIYMLMNMPANGDSWDWSKTELSHCLDLSLKRLEKNGLELADVNPDISVTGPNGFEQLFPGSGGSLYGRASHGWMASFQRLGSRSRIGGLYFAGGSVHPGPGVPMAALSGKLAAECLISDLALT